MAVTWRGDRLDPNNEISLPNAYPVGSTVQAENMSQQTSAGSVPFVLVTGASSGIGRAIAVTLSQSYPLILCGRNKQRLEQTRLACEHADRHLPWAFDLADIGLLEQALPQLLTDRKITIGAFVHCAASLIVLPLRSITLAQTTALFNVNVLSAMEIVRLLTRKQVNGKQLNKVVFISSVVSQFGAKGFSAYGASKAALDGLMKSLAVELAPAVRVNSVLPGTVKTAMTEAMFDDPETADRLGQGYPLGLGAPSDISNAVEFLLSDKAGWITGQQLVVDGGRSVTISA